MSRNRRIYLDHAATSWPKSDAVLNAMDRFARQCGAAAGRGGYQSAAESDKIVAMTRRVIATLIHAESADCISFHANGTAALNAAIHGVVRHGDHVVTTAADHNSVLRPLHHLKQHRGVTVTVVPADKTGLVDAEQVVAAVTDRTRLVAMTHASNVTGAVQPVAEVARQLESSPAIFLCDAAQSFGLLPMDVSESGMDMLASPGHKGSGGPLGTGFLYVSPSSHEKIVPMIQGGTGSQSESLEMPASMPSMLETGNLNVPALAGWLEALRELQEENFESRVGPLRNLARRLHEGLGSIDHLRVLGSPDSLPIASIVFDGLSPTDAATILDAEYGIETRAGMHCAALIHAHLGSAQEGTLRISAGHTTSESDIDAAVDAVREISATLRDV